MLSKRFFDDARIQKLSQTGKLLYLFLLLRRGDHDSNVFETTHEHMVNVCGGRGVHVSNVLDQLQSFQLLTYEKIDSFINRIEINRIEMTTKETDGVEKSVSKKQRRKPLEKIALKNSSEALDENVEPSKPTAQDLFDLWNRVRGPLPKAIALSQDRITNAKKRLAENPDLEYWKTVIEKMAASKFCTGKNDSGWRADFDFLLKKDSHLKVLENKYSWEPPKQEQQISTLHRI